MNLKNILDHSAGSGGISKPLVQDNDCSVKGFLTNLTTSKLNGPGLSGLHELFHEDDFPVAYIKISAMPGKKINLKNEKHKAVVISSIINFIEANNIIVADRPYFGIQGSKERGLSTNLVGADILECTKECDGFFNLFNQMNKLFMVAAIENEYTKDVVSLLYALYGGGEWATIKPFH